MNITTRKKKPCTIACQLGLNCFFSLSCNIVAQKNYSFFFVEAEMQHFILKVGRNKNLKYCCSNEYLINLKFKTRR